MANSLKKIISPFFLRRTKAEVSREQKENHDNSDGKQKEDAPEYVIVYLLKVVCQGLMQNIPCNKHYTVFIQHSPINLQLKIIL